MKKIQRILYWLFIGLPILSLAFNAISWLRFGLDLPFFDDWRGYASGEIHSLDLKYLFRPVNDTMVPVGFALDALAQRYLDGNPIPYQFLSMVAVLGSLLLLQWRLLQQALGNSQLAAICFVFTLLMLQPGSYWGRENMAYHQALPLVFILASLSLLLTESAKEIWRIPLVTIFSLLAGFSYISGAFGVLATGIALLFTCCFQSTSKLRNSIRNGGLVLTISGTFSSAIQFLQSSKTRRGDFAIALPTDLDFWMFYLGKIGRSLALPQERPIISILISIFILTITLVLIFYFQLHGKYKKTTNTNHSHVGIIFTAIFSFVIVYLALISAGRANLHPPEIKNPTQIFSFGFYRFHFFWATLLWPWLAAALIVAGKEFSKATTIHIELLASTVAMALIPLMITGGVFEHALQYKTETFFRLPTIACLTTQLQKDGPINCPEFNMPDFRPAYAYGKSTNASFVRHFPILPVALGSNEPEPWFRLTRDRKNVTMKDISQNKGSDFLFTSGTDAQILFKTKNKMEKCLHLDVKVNIQAKEADTAQLFYQSRESKYFLEERSLQLPVSKNTGKSEYLNFQLSSPSGFEDNLRLDPVSKAQDFNILEIEARCRWSSPPD